MFCSADGFAFKRCQLHDVAGSDECGRRSFQRRVAHVKPGSAIIDTPSINSDSPNPTLLACATTKCAIQNATAGLAQLLAEKGICANAVAPGPI